VSAEFPDGRTHGFATIRDLLPKTSVVSALYRTPVLVDIQSGEFSDGDECEFDALRH
jgi:hypothetical protein